jgi:hypothetical protein
LKRGNGRLCELAFFAFVDEIAWGRFADDKEIATPVSIVSTTLLRKALK